MATSIYKPHYSMWDGKTFFQVEGKPAAQALIDAGKGMHADGKARLLTVAELLATKKPAPAKAPVKPAATKPAATKPAATTP